VLAHGLREPSRPGWALRGAGELGWSVEVPKGPDEGVELRTARRRTDGCPSVDNDRGVIGLDEAWNIYGTCLGPRID